MRLPRRLAAFAIVLASSAAAAAAASDTATPERAQAIARGYAEYLGQAAIDNGIVSVSASGADYVVTWDLRKAMDLIAPLGAVSVDPLIYRLTPSAGGAWTLKGEHFPRVSFDVKTEKGQASGAVDFDGFHVEGAYDPAASDFARAKLGIDALRGEFELTNNGQQSRFAIDQDGLTLEARGKAAAKGPGVDLAIAQAFSGMKETIAAPALGEDADAGLVTYAMANTLGGATLSGLRANELADLWRYVVGHAGKPAAANELNARILAALPFWNNIDAHADIGDLQFHTRAGEARMKRLGETFRVTGATHAGAAELGVEIQDLEVTSDLAPSWLDAMWPASLSLSLSLSCGGWDEAARFALGDPGFGETPDLSPETEGQIQAALLAGHPKLALAPGHLKLPMLDLAFEGEATAGASGAVAHLKASADSLDKTIAWLAEVGGGDPGAQGAALTATYFKGLARTENGRLTWDIDIAADGAMTINGASLPTPN